MSNSSVHSDSQSLPDVPTSFIRSISTQVRTGCRAVGFWSAIALPFVSLPMLTAGITSPTEAAVFLGLLATNFVAVYAGRNHHRE